MSELAEFQKAFAAQLLADRKAADQRFEGPAFAVYRNTAARGVVEALRASFPTVDSLLGQDMFTEVALDYRRGALPAGPVLSDYGASFPEYLASQPWTGELPYLADVARLDRLWLESFLAGTNDRPSVAFDGAARIAPHPAARFAWLQTPALTIWQAHREADDFDELEPDWCEEGALFVRPGLQVLARPIDRVSHDLLLMSAGSPRVDHCVASLAEAYPNSDIPELLQQCLALGALIIQ